MADTYLVGVRTKAGALEFYDKATGTVLFGTSCTNAMTAYAGGGQTNATPITTVISRFTTVANSGDSSILPLSAPGAELTVVNAGSQPMSVYPQSGEAINAGAVNAAFSVANGKTAFFSCAVTGTWNSVLTA